MSSITSPPAKIHLASTTKISLNDRFAKLAKFKVQKETSSGSMGNGSHSSSSAASQHQEQTVRPVSRVRNPEASSRNKNLALSMANRPSVRAALHLKNKSIQQQQRVGQLQEQNRRQQPSTANSNGSNNGRLGSANSSRINSARPQQQQPQQQAGFDPHRLSINGRIFNNKVNLAQRLGPRPQSIGNLRARVGLPSRGGKQFRRQPLVMSGIQQAVVVGSINQRIRRVGAAGNAKRGGGFVARGRGARAALNNSGRVTKRTSLGNRSFTKNAGQKVARGGIAGRRGGGRGRGGARNAGTRNGAATGAKKQEPKSRENLDMDLDQYMSKSKSHLDHDLDSYMAQAQQQQQQQSSTQQ